MAEAEHLAARIVAAASDPWEVRGRPVGIHVSLGLSITDSGSTDPTSMLRDADAAMYLAKQASGSTSATRHAAHAPAVL